MNVDKTNSDPAEETEPAEIAKNTEIIVNATKISISTWAEKTDEATNLEDSVSDIERWIFDKVAKGKVGKDFKTDTNLQMKQYPNLDLRWIWDVTIVENIYLKEQHTWTSWQRPPGPQEGAGSNRLMRTLWSNQDPT